MRIVFMGTPSFAVESLKAIVDKGYEVVGVFSQPDKPKGRGYKLTPPPVKEYALSQGIPVYQPESLKPDEVHDLIRSLNPDVIAVVAYGRILPKEVLEIPPFGCVNVHASLLPKYRGAAPIQWSVINGEKVTGVTTMFMDEGLDTGDIILASEVEIGENETASELFERLAPKGGELLATTLKLIEEGKAERTPQDDSKASYAPILTKEDAKIDFTLPAYRVHNHIRGMSQWPCAFTNCFGSVLKVYKSRVADGYSGKPGEVLDKKRFIVGCGQDTAVEFTEVQLQGGKRMPAESFVLGRRLEKGKLLSEH